MKCSQCGAEVTNEMVFCPKCGNNLALQRSEERREKGEMPRGGIASQVYNQQESEAKQDAEEAAQIYPGIGYGSREGGQSETQSGGPTVEFVNDDEAHGGPAYGDARQVSYGAKSKIVAGLLAIFLGSFGIHKFYLGYSKEGLTMLLVTIFGSIITLGLAAVVMEIISLVEGVIYLTRSDEQFYETYEVRHKGWF